jgi:Zn-dependent M16 (insulinase) family peptidase
MKQARREQLLDVTKDQVREVAQKYIVDALTQNKERVVFLGEKRDWVDKSWTINEMDINGVE